MKTILMENGRISTNEVAELMSCNFSNFDQENGRVSIADLPYHVKNHSDLPKRVVTGDETYVYMVKTSKP